MLRSLTMDENSYETIKTLCKQKKWKEILETFHDVPDRCKILWVFPSEANLQFIGETLRNQDVKEIISIGCGTGLLEWIISEATGLPVTGVEVDGGWWSSRYAPPTFIPLHLAEAPLRSNSSTAVILRRPGIALLFCYFNNRPAFSDYMRLFPGCCLIIAGPGEGRGAHADPSPLTPGLDATWQLQGIQEVRCSHDFIAVYHRSGTRLPENASLEDSRESTTIDG